MNIAEPFIRRPVATTLLVMSILIFGIMGYRLLPVSDLPTVDFPTIQVQREPARREPGDDGRRRSRRRSRSSSRRSPASTSISSSNSQGSTNITLQFDLNRNIDAAAQDVQSMIARTRALAAARHAVAAVVPEGQPGRLADPVPGAQLADAAAVRRSTSTPRRCSRSGCRRSRGVAQVNVFGAQKYAVRVRRRSDCSSPRARSASIRSRTAIADGERQSADRHAVRARPQLRRAGQRSAA